MRKPERFPINNLVMYLKALEKQEPTNSKISRRKAIIKFRAEINQTGNKKKYKASMKPRIGSLKRHTTNFFLCFHLYI